MVKLMVPGRPQAGSLAAYSKRPAPSACRSLFGVAHFLIEDMGRYQHYKGRALNSHT